jgi:hypothetical protein
MALRMKTKFQTFFSASKDPLPPCKKGNYPSLKSLGKSLASEPLGMLVTE